MSMLDRIKKRQNEGFKEFVLNMETTPGIIRGQIFITGVLEDPVYMSYVMKNIRTFEDFLKLHPDEIELVLNSQEQMITLLAKCLFSSDDFKNISQFKPRHQTKLNDELFYIKEVTPIEREGAKFYIVKQARKFQSEEQIKGFEWLLPPQELYYPKPYKDGPVTIHFENEVVAAEGNCLKSKRFGFWRHNYDNGNILAEGEYSEGLKTGVWVFYYSNGNIRSQGKFKGDLRHGIWKEWDREGKITEIEFHQGARVTA
jgi:hypothetical protein